MITTFKNLSDLQKYFHSEQVCREYLEKARWGETVACPHCGTTATPYKIDGGKRYKCSDKDCCQKFSAISGTIFENTKLPLTKWFIAIYLIDSHKKGISSLQLSRDLGITQRSAWFVLHRVREMLRENEPTLLEGMVQVDATLVGGKLSRKSNARRKAIRAKYEGKVANDDGKATVLSLLANGKTVSTHVIESEKAEHVLPVMLERIRYGSTMVTDESNAYKALTDKFKHVSVNHSKEQYVKNGFTTNGVESYFAILKRGIYGIYHQVSSKHLHRYCDEFSYRFNTREKTESERFEHSFTQADGRRLTYNGLIGKEK